MTPLGFLLDNHTPKWWVTAVLKANPAVRIARVGNAGQPPVNATDRDLLRHCEEEMVVLVTCDRRTMYDHIAAHVDEPRWFRESYPH